MLFAALAALWPLWLNNKSGALHYREPRRGDLLHRHLDDPLIDIPLRNMIFLICNDPGCHLHHITSA